MAESSTATSVLKATAEKVSVLRSLALYLWKRGWASEPVGVQVSLLSSGTRMACNLADETQRRMYFDRFEKSETDFFKQFLRPGDTVVDVGAHIGWFSLLAGNLVGSDGQIYCFEAFPPNLSLLERNIELNSAENVRLTAAAVSDSPGELIVGRQSDSGSVTAVDRHRKDSVSVPCIALDSVLSNVNKVRLLKVDVEGFEAKVLKGGQDVLKRVEMVLIEINEPAIEAAGGSKIEIDRLLRDAGFSKSTPVAESGLRRFRSRSRRVVNYVYSR